ncbi:MAG: ABC transporter permease [Acidimicrobiales bacterium]|nr:ABC transporter permease [Acidimicrobiales bacterium]
MLRITVKGILDHGIRFALTCFAVIVGVAFLVGTFVLTDSLRDSLNDLANDIVGRDVDLVVRTSLGEVDSQGLTFNRLPLPEGVLDVVAAVPGVKNVEGRVTAPNVTPIDGEGEVLETRGPPLLGMNYSVVEGLDRLHIQPGGRAPEYRGSFRDPGYVGEFIIDQFVVDRYAFEIGQVYRITAGNGTASFRLVAIATYGNPEKSASIGALITGFDEQTAQEFLGSFAAYSEIVVTLEDTADPDAVRAAIEAAAEEQKQAIGTEYFLTLLANPEEIPAGIRAQIEEGGGGTDLTEAQEELAKTRVEAVTAQQAIEEAQSQFDEVLDILSGVLLGFALIAVVVSAFIISNTFTIVLGQRTRELGLLRALGATGRQVSQSVALEALIVGLVSTVIGIALGYGLGGLLKWLLTVLDFGPQAGGLPLRPRTILLSFVIGIGVTMLSAILPAWRARRVSPMAALREDARLPPGSLRRRTVLGAIVLAVGIGLAIYGLLADPETNTLIAVLAFGALCVFGGVYMLSPLTARPITRALSSRIAGAIFLGLAGLLALGAVGSVFFAAIQFADGAYPAGAATLLLGAPLLGYCGNSLARSGLDNFDVVGRLAADNAGRSPRRTASTAASLTIGLALVATVAVVADSVLTSFRDTLDNSVEADYFAFVNTFDPTAGFSPEGTEQLRSLTEGDQPVLDTVVPFRFAIDAADIGGEDNDSDVLATDLANLTTHINADIIEGGTEGTGRRSVLLHTDAAEEFAVGVGDTIEVEFPGNRGDDFTVAAIYADSTILGNYTFDIVAFDEFLPAVPDAFVTLTLAESIRDTDDEVVLEFAENSIVRSLRDFPQVIVQDRDTFQEGQEQQLASILAIIVVFLGLTFVIAVIGIANTLALSVFERTREIGLLRAVGMTRGQARRSIRSESILVALFGGLLGLAIGLAFGVIIAAALPETFIDRITIPWLQLAGFLIATIVFGLLAAIFPARRAARMNVLEAISHE